MRKIILLTAFLFGSISISAQTTTAETTIKPLGTFYRVKQTGEHAYGYDVSLWQQGTQIYGLISAHAGLIGDPPTGLLENVRYDAQTKKFSFTAKLSRGWSNNKPTRETFEFSGTLTNKRLTGSLIIVWEDCVPQPCSEKRVLNLPRSKEVSSRMDVYGNYNEWKTFADQILERLGPPQ